MRKCNLFAVVTLAFTLLSATVFAHDSSTGFSTVKAMYKNQFIQIEAGSDIEGYSYLGIMVGRKESTPPNSPVPNNYDTTGNYTKPVVVAGNGMYFIPESQVTVKNGTRMFNLNYNSDSVRTALFTTKPSLTSSKIETTMHSDSRVFALEWYHVYRQPDGKIIAVGKGFSEYKNPYRTFFKVGPHSLDIDVETGAYNKDTPMDVTINFSEPVNIRGTLRLKFNNYPTEILLSEDVNKSGIRSLTSTITLPSDFPETNRNFDFTLDNLPNSSSKSEYFTLEPDKSGKKNFTSVTTGLPPEGYTPEEITGSTPTKLTPFTQIGETKNNSVVYDNSRPTVGLTSMVVTNRYNTTLPTHVFDSTGGSNNPIWFNGQMTTVLGEYSDSGSGPGLLSIFSPTDGLIKSGTLPNPVLVTPKLPPYRIGTKSVVANQNAVMNLDARLIRDAVSSETEFEGEVGLSAVLKDMLAYDRTLTNHQERQTFKAYVDLYPPELESAVVQPSGEKVIKFKSENAKIKKVEFMFVDSIAYNKSMESDRWTDVPEFYLYPDKYNHGADTLEAFADHMVGNSNLAGHSTIKKTEVLATPKNTFENTYIDLLDQRFAWILYRTEDELGNIGYGHKKGEVITRGRPFLTEIDTPVVHQYFSNLPATNNSVINVKARSNDTALEKDEVIEAVVKFTMYNETNPNVPIPGMENIELGRISLNGPQWTEYRYDINLANYIVNPEDLDGNLILELNVHHAIDETMIAVPARVPIKVHSKTPGLTHTTDVPITTGNMIPNVRVDTVATSAIPLYGVFNNVSTVNTVPPFILGDVNANKDWKKIEATHREQLENLNGEIFYNVVVYDQAKNKASLQVGPISMYSDLESYVYSTSVSTFVGPKAANSTPTLVLTDKIDNPMLHYTKLNSLVQLPMLNLDVKIIEEATNRVINTGNSTSTMLELPFVSRNSVLDYRKYVADYSLTSGLPVDTPVSNRTAEVYTIVDPIQTLFDIELNKTSGTLNAKATLKSNLSTKQFSNGETLQSLVTNSNAKFGINLTTELLVAVNQPVSHTSAKPLNSSGVNLPIGNDDFIAIGYRGKNGSPDYELRFKWDTNLANAQITNVPSSLVQASSSYEIQIKATHLGNHYTLPANITEDFKRDFKVNIMVIPNNTGLYNPSESLSQNWSRLASSSYNKDYFVKENRTIENNGKYDILVEVVTPFKIKCYDYKQLDLLLADKEDYLASENNPSLLVSNTTVFNSLSRKLVNHGIKATKASEVGAYQLQSGNMIVFSKIQQNGADTVVEIYDNNFNLVKKLSADDIGVFNKINDVIEIKNIILLGTNAGLFSISSDYTNLNLCQVVGSSVSASAQVYQLELFNSMLVMGVDDTNTLQLVECILNNDGTFQLKFNSSKTATELFGADKRVKKIQVRNSSIYVTYDTDPSVVNYTVLE